MDDELKTKEELIKEINSLRKDIKHLKRNQTKQNIEKGDRLNNKLNQEEWDLYLHRPTIIFSWPTKENGITDYVSPNIKKILGYDPEDFTSGRLCYTAKVHPEDLPRVLQEVQNYSNSNIDNYEQEYRIQGKDDKYHWFHDRTMVIRDNSGTITYSHSYLQDISDSKKAEQAISMFFEQSLVMLYIADLETKKFVRVNKEVIRITGHTEIKLLTQPIIDFIHPDDRKSIEKVFTMLKKGYPASGIRTRYLTNQDEYRTFEWNATAYDKLHLAYIMAIDVTEREKEDAELRNIQRLESLGFVAGGLAHDFNNLLQGLFLYISLAKDNPGIDPEVAEYLNNALACFDRAKDLTQQLLTFAKGGSPIKKLLNVETLLQDSKQLALSGSNIKCTINMSKKVHPVKADTGQLHQAINNILLNSRHAMPDGGNIIITCSNKDIQKGQIQNLTEGPYVSITIQDHGIGIRKELLSKVFDPFFTTKQIGSGLGLSTAYSIIKKHKGYISIDSELGVGTIVTILLPASTEKIEEQIIVSPYSSTKKIRILLMDDEQIILDSTSRLLMKLGYTVDLAHTGEQAIQLYVEAMKLGRKYDIIILDLTVPGGMGGEKVLKHLLKIDPDIKALVSSGYSDSEILTNPQEFGFIDKITKPYDKDDLIAIFKKIVRKNISDFSHTE